MRELTATKDGPVPVIIAPAEIDIGSRSQLHAELLAASRQSATVIVDMSQTIFCDSCGFNILVRARERAAADGGELRLAALHGSPRRALTVLGADRLFPIFSTVAEAQAVTTS
jgi:anti-sigma B factor antagonist